MQAMPGSTQIVMNAEENPVVKCCFPASNAPIFTSRLYVLKMGKSDKRNEAENILKTRDRKSALL
jgi:hypothetical protein